MLICQPTRLDYVPMSKREEFRTLRSCNFAYETEHQWQVSCMEDFKKYENDARASSGFQGGGTSNRMIQRALIICS